MKYEILDHISSELFSTHCEVDLETLGTDKKHKNKVE